MNWYPQLQSSKWIWIAFSSCAILVLAAMLWLTRSVIKTEHQRSNAEIRAEIQERVRLSLWRMDSLGSSILLEENLIPVNLFLENSESALPVKIRFETLAGVVTSSQGEPESRQFIQSLLPKITSTYIHATRKELPTDNLKKAQPTKAQPPKLKVRANSAVQKTANLIEKGKRSAWMSNTLALQNKQYSTPTQKNATRQTTSSQSTPTNSPAPVGEFKTARFDDALLLIRQGASNPKFLQCSLIDQTLITKQLLSEATPLLPNAKLEPTPTSSQDPLVLASFPFKLSPGSLGITGDTIPHTTLISLSVGWLAAATALITAFFLISRIMELSERRASFVSAVTHELRTPLTTFRLYSDMLSQGIVKEEKKQTYLTVLSREADRLSHLVENVLSFSKIEKGSARSNLAEIELNTLLESFRERLSSRLNAANLTLEYKLDTPAHLTLDSFALEHILFNLIDNAAKYAANSTPPSISLSTTINQKSISIQISDHGPGIPKEEYSRIFQPFHKSAKEAAETKPGVGLGLALSKRLAKSMQGKISCSTRPDKKDGASFTLILPRLSPEK